MRYLISILKIPIESFNCWWRCIIFGRVWCAPKFSRRISSRRVYLSRETFISLSSPGKSLEPCRPSSVFSASRPFSYSPSFYPTVSLSIHLSWHFFPLHDFPRNPLYREIYCSRSIICAEALVSDAKHRAVFNYGEVNFSSTWRNLGRYVWH